MTASNPSPWPSPPGERGPLLLALLLAGCTLSNPFGTECVSDENCGCANCCIAYRCTAYGPQVPHDDGGSTDAGATDAGGTDAGTTDAGFEWVISTFAGGPPGTQDGHGTDAGFNSPTALALDTAGNLYVADTNNNCVRKISPDGDVTTLAPGVFPCGGTGLMDPQGVAVDDRGNVFVSNTAKNCLKLLTPDGGVVNLAGSCTQQPFQCADSPTPAVFEGPAGLVWLPPYLYIGDAIGNRIRTYRLADGQVGTLAGLGSSTRPLTDGVCQFGTSCGTSTTAAFYGPVALSVAAGGVLYVADRYNCAIRKVSTQPGCSVTTLGPQGCPMLISQESLAMILSPSGVAVGTGASAGLVFVGDTRNHRIAALDSSGALIHIAGARARGWVDGPAEGARFNTPTGIVMDQQGRLFVADSANHRIRMLVRVPR